MTKASKFAKILLTLTLLVLAFCCSFNVTTAYFTASSTRSGQLKFPNLDVRFLTLNENDQISNQSQTIMLHPIGGTIVRGQRIEVSLTEASENKTQVPVKNITIRNMENSIPAYLRFWIDAYVVTNPETGEVDTSKNYGQYFLIDLSADNVSKDSIVRGGSNASASEGSWCYFKKSMINPYGNPESSILLGNAIILDENTSDEIFTQMLGKSFKIMLSLKAVQVKNEAFRTAFNDKKGYYNSWSGELDEE